jgi:sugar phosphate isomerase/epimerase
VIRRLGVCSWSLQPTGPRDLAAKVASIGLRAVQLALDPIRTGAWSEPETRAALEGVQLLSGMMGTKGEDYSTLDSIRRTGGVRPDSTWPDNLAAAKANATLAKRLGLSLVTFHAGFLPHDRRDPERARMIDRLRQVAAVFADCSIRIAFETGQESADTLLEVLDELPTVGVNFDPANMILYGMGDPVEAVKKLAPRIAQFHIKDAIPSPVAGQWGEEVVAGTGAVRWPDFFAAAASIAGDFIIEREAGTNRIADVIAARRLVETYA